GRLPGSAPPPSSRRTYSTRLGDPRRHPQGLHDPRRRHHLLATPHPLIILIGLLSAISSEVDCPAVPGPYPARAGGPWLWSTLVLSLFHAVVVPSGFTTRVQPQRWMAIWWWNGHKSTQSLTEVFPPLALCFVWCTSHAPAGWRQPPAHWQCRSRNSTALRIPAGTVSAYPMSSGRLGPPSRAHSWRRRRNDASPPGPETRSTALPITACSIAAHAAVVSVPGPPAASPPPARRSRSSSAHSRTRSSSAATFTSPVTSGAIAASHAIPPAASPSSQAPPSLPAWDADARRAAHRSRICAVHCSCRAESPARRTTSARAM